MTEETLGSRLLRVFIDTEFTSIEVPELLSIGMASEDDDCEMYAELDLDSETGRRRVRQSSNFVLTHVLPQFRKMPPWLADESTTATTLPDVSVALLQLAAAKWLYALIEHFNRDLELVYADKVDGDLLEAALSSTGKWWALIEGRLSWSIVSYLHGEAGCKAAADESWTESRRHDGVGRHHALADARALRAAFIAMHDN